MTKSKRQNRQQLPAGAAPNTVVQFQHQQYSGLLPHPDLFVAYNRGVPDAADRILVMAEELQRETIAGDKEIIAAHVHDNRSGWNFAHRWQVFSFVFVMSYMLILGLTVWFENLTMFGAVFSAGAIAGLANLVRSFQNKGDKH